MLTNSREIIRLENEEGAPNEAAQSLKKREKIQDWLARQADDFLSDAVQAAGKEFGKWGMQAAIGFLLDKLFSVREIAGQWLSRLHLPF